MKKLLTSLVLSAFILTGCGSNPVQTVQQPVERQDEEMGWFVDEVLDMDDWGEKKKYKVKSLQPQPKAEAKPKPKVDVKMPVAKQKTSASKRNP